MIEVIINMGNKNALIALAYIKENENPFIVFCNYIIYCLQKSDNKQAKHDELSKMIESEFGLIMSEHMIKECVRLLRRKGTINRLEDGSGYELLDLEFDIYKFYEEKNLLEEKERILINELITYVKEIFKKDWDYEQAREYLTEFLVIKEHGVDIFSDRKIEISAIKPSDNSLSEEFFVGKFVEHLIDKFEHKTDNEFEKDNYLLDVVNGLMIYIGVHETEDYINAQNQKFDGTDFYLDTKFLLRAMGYSWNYEVKAANELINLITNEYGGNICVFEHTVREVEYALLTAKQSLEKKQDIRDFELRMYAEINNITDFDFDIYEQSAERFIESILKVQIKSSVIKIDGMYHLGTDELNNYINSKAPLWNIRAIQNDVNSINYINILRKGNYDMPFGGEEKLPIFVTTNRALINLVRDYIKDHGFLDKGVANWKPNALPLISDYSLMCRLWTPKSESLPEMPILTLASNAYAAQQANSESLDRLRSVYKEYGQKHKNIDIINIPIFKRIRLEEFMIAATEGVIEDLTEDVVATSFEEFVKDEKAELEAEIETLKKYNKEQEQQIIKSISNRFKNKIGFFKRFLVYSCMCMEFIIVGLFAIISIFIPNLKTISWLPIITPVASYIIIFVIFKVMEKILSKKLSVFLLKKVMPFVWEKYKTNVNNLLDNNEKKYENEILNICIQNTPLLNKNSNYFKI